MVLQCQCQWRGPGENMNKREYAVGLPFAPFDRTLSRTQLGTATHSQCQSQCKCRGSWGLAPSQDTPSRPRGPHDHTDVLLKRITEQVHQHTGALFQYNISEESLSVKPTIEPRSNQVHDHNNEDAAYASHSAQASGSFEVAGPARAQGGPGRGRAAVPVTAWVSWDHEE